MGRGGRCEKEEFEVSGEREGWSDSLDVSPLSTLACRFPIPPRQTLDVSEGSSDPSITLFGIPGMVSLSLINLDTRGYVLFRHFV